MGLREVGTLVTDGKLTTTPGIDVKVWIEVKIRHVTPIVFIVPIVLIIVVNYGSESIASFRGRKVFFGLTMAAKIQPLLKCV